MKGYWHIAALSVVAAAFTVIMHSYLFVFAIIVWLFYLFFSERLGKIPVLVSLTFLLVFPHYIPDVNVPSVISPQQEVESEAFYGEIISEVKVSESKIEFIFEEKKTSNQLLILYFIDKNDLPKDPHNFSLNYGANCTIKGESESPNESRNKGQFNYRDYLLKQNISYQIILRSLGDIHCEGSSFLNRFYKLRLQLINTIKESVSPYTASWLNSLVLGDDTSLDKETVELFQRWGLSHIIAISGTHIGLLLGFLYLLMIKLNLLTREKAQWVVIWILPVYALLAGGEPSVWRASLMVMCFILLSKLKVTYSVTDILSIVFILLILIEPHVIYHVGFQLSFLVTFSILLSKRWIFQTGNGFFQALNISFVSQMIIIPLQFNYFTIFQPLSILLNVIVIPYFSIIVIPFMYVLLPLSILPLPIIRFLDQAFVFIHEYVLSFIHWVDRVADYPWLIGNFSLGFTIVYYVFLLAFMNNIEQKKLNKAWKSGACITIIIFYLALRPYFSPVGTVTMLDIGQGDAFVIELPYRKGVFMIDAGARVSFDEAGATDAVYKQIIKPYLDSRGIQKIDVVFLTHEDADHIGSVSNLLEDKEVGKIVVSEYFELPAEQKQRIQDKVNVEQVTYNTTVNVKGQELAVLGPSQQYSSVNDNSLILYTEIGGLKWLFTGDISDVVERELIKRYPSLHADVLKVAHHGSNTSTNHLYLQHINPEVALIPVGQNNMYGHPSQDVLQLLADEAITTLRSDQQGMIQYRFKAESGTFFSFFP
ncbi:DNA internalization-related competence protein ComEC/Rec2 [Oceanobacillus bengalensis]|uniref:DNA internalization-related competence protein ComEC/Rec2 n=1 Tax=Oceanobacillus bengalensis TaxID=1435466 RepID=A0A494Z5Q8_9BACI|nr:DNA internalization-related competence protein ComEC/Rec2 [Oceanobacillus bengalensis]RKQ17870.1 DNA internalization-related competence protein ComEC/Rec2 [Oceanobacillus bengalensis]